MKFKEKADEIIDTCLEIEDSGLSIGMGLRLNEFITKALKEQAKEIFDEIGEIGEEYSDVDNLHCLSIQISKLLKLKAEFKEE